MFALKKVAILHYLLFKLHLNFSAILYIKAKIGRHYALIINDILRVPYMSDVQLFCKGSGKVSWIYQKTKLGDVHNDYVGSSSTIDENLFLTLNIDKINRRKMGFYICKNIYQSHEMQKHVLVTSCK